MRARKTGDPKKETAAARRKRKKNQRSADEVLAKRAPQPSTRKTNRVSSETKRTASVIKEGKRRTEKQKYRSEKTFRKESIRNISDSRAARLKKRFDKNVAKEDRLKNEASKGFDDTRGTKKGSVSKSRLRSVDTTKGAATLSRTRGRKVVKAVDRDKAMKLKKKYKKFAKGGKFPDLTGDGKVTRADILKGRGVFRSGGKVPKGKYKTSDGREISKSSAREAAIKEIKRKASNKAAKAHKQGEKRGKKVVGKRRVIKAGNPRTLSGGVEYKNIYKKERRKEEQGKKKVQKYIDKQARKYAPKPKKQRTPRGGAGTPKPGNTVNYAEKQRRGAKVRNFFRKCAGNTCAQKQRRSGGSAAYK